MLAALPASAMLNKLPDTNENLTGNSNPLMPLLFLGHGSPMNAISENEFVRGFRQVAAGLPKPKAILCISAHWETRGTKLTAMEHPPTIHDFGGFPKALYDIQYPAPGSPELVKQAETCLRRYPTQEDHSWGLDHGAWTVLRHIYPEADVPVVQMSLDYNKKPAEHYHMAKDLADLRRKGVLIVGSGNLVHNLGMVAWDKMDETYGYDWALSAMDAMRKAILHDDHSKLIGFASQGRDFQLSIPSAEHFLPVLYILGLKKPGESVNIFNDKPLAGSLSMTSIKIG